MFSFDVVVQMKISINISASEETNQQDRVGSGGGLVVPQASTLPSDGRTTTLFNATSKCFISQDPLLTITAQAFLHSYFIFLVHFLCGLSSHLTKAVSEDVAKRLKNTK